MAHNTSPKQKTTTKTRKQLTELLASTQAKAMSPKQLAELITQEFNVVKISTATKRYMQPTPQVNQLWRNRSSNRLVRISTIDNLYNIIWEAADDSRGPKTGRGYRPYWADRFDYVGTSKNQDPNKETTP